jgi:hypothetical protein
MEELLHLLTDRPEKPQIGIGLHYRNEPQLQERLALAAPQAYEAGAAGQRRRCAAGA